MCMKRWLAAALLLALLLGAARAEGPDYQNGVYRGFYYSDGLEQVAVQFELKDGIFESVVLRNLKNSRGSFMTEGASDWQKVALSHFNALCSHLEGKGVDEIEALYAPQEILAAAGLEASEHVPYSKLISALWDGLNRRPYKLVDTSRFPQFSAYADGTYRGAYMEDGGEQVALEFTLRDNRFTAVSFRTLQYEGVDYLAGELTAAQEQIAAQFKQLIDYLVGREVSAVNDLYLPGNIAGDTDAFSGATLRSPKVISAVWDGLNRHAYRID